MDPGQGRDPGPGEVVLLRVQPHRVLVRVQGQATQAPRQGHLQGLGPRQGQGEVLEAVVAGEVGVRGMDVGRVRAGAVARVTVRVMGKAVAMVRVMAVEAETKRMHGAKVVIIKYINKEDGEFE